jgi:hypothetical protein
MLGRIIERRSDDEWTSCDMHNHYSYFVWLDLSIGWAFVQKNSPFWKNQYSLFFFDFLLILNLEFHIRHMYIGSRFSLKNIFQKLAKLVNWKRKSIVWKLCNSPCPPQIMKSHGKAKWEKILKLWCG